MHRKYGTSWTCCSVLAALIGCAPSELANEAPIGTSAPLSSATPAQAAETGHAAAIEAIGRVVPTWDDRALLRPVNTEDVSSIFDEPRRAARRFVEGEFDFVERRANGKDVFAIRESSAVLKVDRSKGSWEFLRPRNRDARATFSASAARIEAERIADSLVVPRAQRHSIVDDELVARRSDGVRSTLARHVRIHRAVNGIRVRASAMMVTFDLDGAPFRVERAWPDFKLAPAERLHGRAEVLASAAERLARRFAEGNVGKVVSDIAYQKVGPAGDYEPVVAVSVFPADGFGSPERVEYSLISGLLDPAEGTEPGTDA